MKLDPGDPSLGSLLDGPSAATLTVYRADGEAITSPIWPLPAGDHVEVVVPVGDPKLALVARDPRCVLTIFETVRPFRGLTVRSRVVSVEPDEGADLRRSVASRYLGEADGRAYADVARRPPGFRLRIPLSGARAWDLSDYLP